MLNEGMTRLIYTSSAGTVLPCVRAKSQCYTEISHTSTSWLLNVFLVILFDVLLIEEPWQFYCHCYCGIACSIFLCCSTCVIVCCIPCNDDTMIHQNCVIVNCQLYCCDTYAVCLDLCCSIWTMIHQNCVIVNCQLYCCDTYAVCLDLCRSIWTMTLWCRPQCCTMKLFHTPQIQYLTCCAVLWQNESLLEKCAIIVNCI